MNEDSTGKSEHSLSLFWMPSRGNRWDIKEMLVFPTGCYAEGLLDCYLSYHRVKSDRIGLAFSGLIMGRADSAASHLQSEIRVRCLEWDET